MTRRAQLTIPDVVYGAAALLILSALAPVVYQLLNQNAGDFRIGTTMLWQLVVPGMVMTLLIVIFSTAVGGR
ncbi:MULTISPECIES: hypothetical protein [Halobacterium]|uniref:hypothetical protein n=1 Tax=Halobacterium TaxID=2239 RepID=UPI00073F4929|nr:MULTISPECIES: hypothetical protein [Halobacterium]MCG1002861.1 hypothetical protein [Halobacterium noricense]